MKGWIHSVESFGTVDGPGVRMVIFFQGCPMRCAYCHNPDTWGMRQGTLMETEELLERFRRNRSYYKNGGITATGGEPLWQPDFLMDLFRKAKKEGISTCLDTSGVVFPYRKAETGWETAQSGIHEDIRGYGVRMPFEEYEELFSMTDLVLLDLKHMDSGLHRKLTGHANEAVFAFLEFLAEKEVPVWIRRVAVPGHTDDPEELLQLGEYIGGFPNVKAVEVLPYHTMGCQKYEALGIKYRLEGVPEESEEEARKVREQILKGIRKRRNAENPGGF